MHIHVDVYIYIYIYTYTYTYIYIYVYTSLSLYIHIHIYIYIYVHITYCCSWWYCVWPSYAPTRAPDGPTFSAPPRCTRRGAHCFIRAGQRVGFRIMAMVSSI